MKKYFIIISIVILTLTGCYDLTYDIDSTYETANITSVQIYDSTQTNVVSSSTIDTVAYTVNAVIKNTADITKLKLCATVSTGATVNPTMSIGLQDLSQPKVYTVTSPNGTVKKEWTIIVSY